ncbi:MAG: NADH-quinone oxidoreductase subunit G [Ignavibacteriae bacterium]|nr:MAG: NADH-quinone oxidoreductase subunit G [Ignavibacteriota bacterium]
MIKITVDGRELEVDPTLTIIQAAAQNGIEIPHFCWHPKLTVSGNCRMCLVEIEKMPKLVISCATQVADGMVIKTKSEKVVKARNAVMEFLLINHPLDCPICDEAGECKLQDYTYKYSTGYSRFQEDKVHKPKRIELGPNIILDVERCILCSRCIRFSEEIAHQKVLTFTERGTHVVLTTFPGTQLDNPYAMNVVDICPVGALTNRDFRFKARVWEMSSTESICIGCARGCNTNVWVRNNEILRLTPRDNEEVNSSWMCDEGRVHSFKFVSSENRLNGPMIRKDGILVDVGWDEAISKVVSELHTYRKHEIAGISSPYSTNEDNYIFARFFKEVIGSKSFGFLPHTIPGADDDLLIRADKTPNSLGASLLRIPGENESSGIDHILKGISSGTIKVLYVLEDNIAADPRIAEILTNLEMLIVHSSTKNETTIRADVVLSASTFAEKYGTYTNFTGYVQRVRPAVAMIEQERAPDGMAMSRWDKFAARNDSWGKGNKRDARSSWRILAAIASAMGVKMKYASSEEVFKELVERVPAFKGLSYSKIGTHGAPIKKEFIKVSKP